ncbi:dipeptide/tripeptide permease [Dysgonomonas sp. PH5-45]|uniref:MFS transporter n=1 Tax=unclassified Dysgonomonas TaxID=2630389 RepID=UPI0024738F05|nr:MULTISPECIES: MFS transporter [unclassified Dysgonomonas]MDH6355039.1 dipeptide/tripeptide permease [Dysgonomonas sp. PH5-45]MDH6387939.1 dipeptide/tripeptide permease [Dysgonomonas sp. PH5-37]
MAKFPRAFWVANTVELLERLAYYAVFIVLTIYLSNVWGFSDMEAATISGVFSALLYLLPTFVGAYADKIGFRSSIIAAFTFLTIGYLGLAILPTMFENAGLVHYGAGTGDGMFSSFFSDRGLITFGSDTEFSGLKESPYRWMIAPIMLLIVIGGAFIKSVISGTVARETTEENRARGYAIFYMMVNIGAFTGKCVVDPLRKSLGDVGLVYLNYFAATMTLLALIAVFFFYKSANTTGQGKSVKELLHAFGKVCMNFRLIILTFIVSGFWIVQQQMYATMPKYVIRMVGEDASPGWIANVNPLIVFICVNFVTTLMKKRSSLVSMTVGMFIIPISALIMSAGGLFDKGELFFGVMHPITFMLIVGIAFQALAECFISPRYLEYFSLQSPKGEEGLYLGFSQLHSFISSLLAFGLSGYLLGKYCPDRREFASDELYAAATEHAHYIWYYFFAIGLIAAVGLVIYGQVVKRIDAKKLRQEAQ